MKCLKDFENDLNKCSKCGLCESICPLFQLNPNDCVASKGKFIMLHGVTKGELKLSKNINKYLDTCLKCGKCNKFCPSGIDVCQILNTAKYEYMKKNFWSKFINFLESRYIFGIFLKLGSFISSPFRPKRESQHNAVKVMYFKGCVNKISPHNDNYINKIFKNHTLEIIEPDFDCCGLPFLSEGNLERFVQAAKDNIKNFETNYDYLVTDCASCESTLLDYHKYINCNPVPAGKSINFGDLIELKGIKFIFKKPVKVTFHKPCHLKNDAFLNRILANCENVEYIKMKNYDDCCGFAGSFGIKNRNYSIALSKQKAQNITETGADYVITTCPSCIIGLNQGLLLSNSKTKIVNLLEFLAMADEII